MADNKPTIHHLSNSQSQRIVWLAEELGIEYNLVAHERNPPNHPTRPFLSPESLTALGAMGKAPLLITGAKDGNRPIYESSAIATYLIRTYDTGDKFGLKNGDWVRDEILTSVIGTGLGRCTSTILMLDFQILRNGTGPGGKQWDGPNLRNFLGQLEKELKEGPPGGWLMGKEPGRADILLEFPMSSIKGRNTVDLEKEFPALDDWLKRVYARPAFKKALGKAFNGVYDWSIFPKKEHL